MRTEYKNDITMDSSGFVVLAEYIPQIVQEIRYYSSYNFIGDRIDGYEEPCALLTIEAARALQSVSNEVIVQGYRLKVFDAYRPARAVKHFVLWGIEDTDIRMKPYFYPDLEKQALFAEGYIAKQSSHTRGSTVDLTLLDMQTGKEL
ncbi:MAG: peptidase M15, partial [Lachnospiraceae bacterium]|nr:peptidase M15 [Lachnospiraceae bacterium]